MEQEALPGTGEEGTRGRSETRQAGTSVRAKPRLMTADRSQIELRPWDVDSLIPRTHRARALWAFVERLDLGGLYDPIKARGEAAGRPATDPKILLAVWLFAISQGVGSAREIERLYEEHDA
jgi:transposase